MTLCACPCHKQPGPGYEGHPAPGDVPRANLMIGLIGDNGALAMPVPYCWVCAAALTMKLGSMHAGQRDEFSRRAVDQMMRYANEGGAE